MLVELGVLEQRYNAVKDVLDGASVTGVASRNGVVRQTVHTWLRRYAETGMVGLADASSRPIRCPHQMPAEVEAQLLEMRRRNPDWGPRRLLWHLGRAGVAPLPSRSAVYRALVRQGMIHPSRRARKRSDYKRWERRRAMELWQMDVIGRVYLADGTELSVVTGIDDHSRFCVIARLVRRATALPVCDALQHGLHAHGVPESILTDNGKVFTGRFTSKAATVRFDRICHENGIKHILTAPYSPTTTGKIERLHKTMRKEFFSKHTFETIEEAQTALDEWVREYNEDRPHQSLGDAPPVERFRYPGLHVAPAPEADEEEDQEPALEPPSVERPRGVARWVDQVGKISVGRRDYQVGKVFAGDCVEAVVRSGLVQIYRGEVLVATHAQKGHDMPGPVTVAEGSRRPRAATSGKAVSRIVDSNGSVSFAGAPYRAGRSHRGATVQVAVVGGSVQISVEDRVVRVHAARHDLLKEYGAFARPTGRSGRRDGSAPQNEAM